jgi:putative phosphoribosyl transferase
MPFYYTPVDDELSFALDESLVSIAVDDVRLDGYLATHPEAREAVVLADAGPGSRDNREIRFVAEALQEIGLATLQVDLVNEDEEAAAQSEAQQVECLAGRLAQVIAWLHSDPRTAELKLGYFGQGAAAAAALAVAAAAPGSLAALVVVEGALDLAGTQVGAVEAPVLLVVGTTDLPAQELNERARLQLRGERQLALVPGGAGLLTEPLALPHVARLARGWFSRNLAR